MDCAYCMIPPNPPTVFLIVAAPMGVLLCRRMSTNGRRNKSTYRTHSLHPSNALRYVIIWWSLLYLELVSLIYGSIGDFWHFTSDLSKKDSAYTTQHLGAHTDTTYFTDPAGLQTFHLLSHTNGEGGASLLVDGFRAAEILRRESPRSFDILTSYPIPAHASGNDGISVSPARSFPVLARREDSSRYQSRIAQVRWNNDDRAVLPAWDSQRVMGFYDAARKWVEILRREKSEYWVQLKPGRPLSRLNFRVKILDWWVRLMRNSLR